MLNPGWEQKLWDDAECAAFVAAEFPEYTAAYAALPHNVERADFFRYMVVLRLGGVYADIDVECRHPLDHLVSSHTPREIPASPTTLFHRPSPLFSVHLNPAVPPAQIQVDDTLIVGWENEFASNHEAFTRTYSRTAQLEQWVIMGAPGPSQPNAFERAIGQREAIRRKVNL